MRVDGRPVGGRGARGLGGEQAGRGRLDRARAGRAAGGGRAGRHRGAALPGRPPRRRLDRPAAADQRRRARQPAHPPALRSRQDLPGAAARGRRATATSSGCATGSSSRTGRPRRPRSSGSASREIEIVLREGRNRQVRRMVEAVGNRVVALRRVRFGPLALGELAEGGARRLAERGDRRGSGKMRSCERETGAYEPPGSASSRCAAPSRPRRNEAEAILAATDGADAGADRAQRRSSRRRWSAASSPPPTTSTPSSRPSPRASSGLDSVPLLCCREIPVPGSMPRVIRVMLHFYAPAGHVPAHAYLGEAQKLRADLARRPVARAGPSQSAR